MVCPLYLAMSAGEFQHISTFPPHAAWMACHFSPYGDGLSNVPKALPEGSMLMVNDYLPVQGHDPKKIAAQLRAFSPSRVLLDFQRAGCAQTEVIVKEILEALPCPVGVALPYAREGFPVLLPPVPPQTPLREHLQPYKNWEIWLEMAPLISCAEVTEKGTQFIDTDDVWENPTFFDDTLKCHYQMQVNKDSVRFLLRRTKEDVLLLREEGEMLGVSCCVGLYRELCPSPPGVSTGHLSHRERQEAE